MMSGIARYDGHAEWYDQTFSAFLNEEEVSFLRECLGTGSGQICLDVACGTGRCGRILARVPGQAAFATCQLASCRTKTS
jgi:ubiquinone/menaquinone biosynthesis C-methylase UbiE